MSPRRGLFVAVDGPGGVGKSTTVRLLGDRLTAAGYRYRLTREPWGEIGRQACDGFDRFAARVLACMFAADRYQHWTDEIGPLVSSGHVVVCDRYLASGLVVHQLDGVDLDYLRHLNSQAPRPHLAVILGAHPDILTRRLDERGAHNRLQRPEHTARECALYAQAAELLAAEGVPVQRLDTSVLPADAVAAAIFDQIKHLIRPA